MVGKCANPECNSEFRYLHEGRLFAVDIPFTTAQSDEPESIPRPRSVQYFWICRKCFPRIRIEFDRANGNVNIRPRNDSALALRQHA
jgi:hypothetical protein